MSRELRVLAEFPRDLAPLIFEQVSEQHVCAFAYERACMCRTHPSRRAGHDRDAPINSSHD
jgi:hypothetical protein